MTIRSKMSPKKPTKGLVLGRVAAAKLNAVEGISLSRKALHTFAEFDRLGLSAEERRLRLWKQFGGQSR
jgi:hypothetical protein